MSIKNYDMTMEGLQAILDSFNPESEIYKKALALKYKLIESQIPF